MRVRADIIGNARINMYVNLSHAWFTGIPPDNEKGQRESLSVDGSCNILRHWPRRDCLQLLQLVSGSEMFVQVSGASAAQPTAVVAVVVPYLAHHV